MDWLKSYLKLEENHVATITNFHNTFGLFNVFNL